MTAEQNAVHVYRQDQTLHARVEGCGKMPLALPLRRFAEQALEGGIKQVRVDLRHCTYLDSTFLGTLLFLHRAIDRRGEGEFALVSPSPEASRLLEGMGLEGVFSVVKADEPAGAAWTKLATESEDGAFQQNIVEAHQQLADLPGQAGEPFREVMRDLKKSEERRA
jgi:anti-sigma B factor antagonist